MKREKKFDKVAYDNAYIKEKKDRINLVIPKGKKAEWKAKAEEKGKSLTRFIIDRVDGQDD